MAILAYVSQSPEITYLNLDLHSAVVQTISHMCYLNLDEYITISSMSIAMSWPDIFYCQVFYKHPYVTW